MPARGSGGRWGVLAPEVVSARLPGGTSPPSESLRAARGRGPVVAAGDLRLPPAAGPPANPPAAPRASAAAGRARVGVGDGRRTRSMASSRVRVRGRAPMAASCCGGRSAAALRGRSESAAEARGRTPPRRARPAPPPAAPAHPWRPGDPAEPRAHRRRPAWRARVSSGRARASPPAGTPAMGRARMSVPTRAVGRPGAIAKMVLAPMESAQRLTLAIVSASRDRSPRGRHRKGGDRVRGRLRKAVTGVRAGKCIWQRRSTARRQLAGTRVRTAGHVTRTRAHTYAHTTASTCRAPVLAGAGATQQLGRRPQNT